MGFFFQLRINELQHFIRGCCGGMDGEHRGDVEALSFDEHPALMERMVLKLPVDRIPKADTHNYEQTL